MTQQILDSVIVEGDPFAARYNLPLDAKHPQICDLTNSRRPFPRDSSCWRGYVASWEIISCRVHLRDLRGKLKLRSLVPLFADWVSTEIDLPLGHVDPTIGHIYEPIHEFYLVLKVEEGVVVRWRVIKGQDYKQKKTRPPSWRKWVSWQDVKAFVHQSGIPFDFEIADDERPWRRWESLIEFAFNKCFPDDATKDGLRPKNSITLEDIARFMPLEQWHSGKFVGAHHLIQRFKLLDIEVLPG